MKRKIDAMHARYGYSGGFCRDCCNFVSDRYHDRILRKCEAYGLTHSEASDWAGKWLGCGLYNIPFDSTGHRPLIEALRHLRDPTAKKNVPTDGQVRMF